MSAHRRDRSKFDSLSDVERVHVRQRAMTLAEQGAFRRPSRAARHLSGQLGGRRDFADMPDQGEPHKPGNTDGTYNSDKPGDTRGSTMGNTGGGVELLARVINNRARGATAPSGKTGTPVNPPWRPRKPQRQGA